jgi:hypothetical protein
MPFILGHAIVVGYYEVFVSSRSLFTREFGIDVFRMVILEVHGIAVSNVYVAQQVC